MGLEQYANQADDIRAASELARGIQEHLISISKGTHGEDRARKVEQVDVWFRGLADKLGYKVEAA